MKMIARIACGAALLLTAGTASAAVTYSITDLGTLGGSSFGLGINEAGQVTGYSYTAAGTHAFIYTPGSGMTDIDTLGGGDSSYGRDINDAGQVTGVSDAFAASSDAFIYTPGSGMTDIGTLGGSSSVGDGINDAGQVTGWSYTGTDAIHAFVYTPGSGMTDIGTLGGRDSVGDGINDAGQVTGVSNAGTAQHAFIYTPGSGMTDIGTLGGSSSHGLDINLAGEVVGTSYVDDIEYTNHAFLYSGGVLHDLNDLIDPLSGWALASATALNDRGWITGYGTIGGQTHAFLLTPNAVPEPASWAMMIVGFGMVGGAMRRKRRQNVRYSFA
jgi:probable HAF family extracellular repeat protein